MTVKEMNEKISEIERERNVNIYVFYDKSIGWKFEMYGRNDINLARVIPPNQIALWDLVILEGFLHRMASDIEVGVIC